MRREAEAHAAEDEKKKQEIEAKNTADTLAYQAEKILRDNKDKIPANLNTEIEQKIAAVREALKDSNLDALKRATEDLSQSMQKVGAAVYGQPGQQGYQDGPQGPQGPEGGQGGDGGPGKKPDEGTVEGEFKEV
jgi:molecular chaperone DnaK